jgi:hypothetical protein
VNEARGKKGTDEEDPQTPRCAIEVCPVIVPGAHHLCSECRARSDEEDTQEEFRGHDSVSLGHRDVLKESEGGLIT